MTNGAGQPSRPSQAGQMVRSQHPPDFCLSDGLLGAVSIHQLLQGRVALDLPQGGGGSGSCLCASRVEESMKHYYGSSGQSRLRSSGFDL